MSALSSLRRGSSSRSVRRNMPPPLRFWVVTSAAVLERIGVWLTTAGLTFYLAAQEVRRAAAARVRFHVIDGGCAGHPAGG